MTHLTPIQAAAVRALAAIDAGLPIDTRRRLARASGSEHAAYRQSLRRAAVGQAEAGRATYLEAGLGLASGLARTPDLTLADLT